VERDEGAEKPSRNASSSGRAVGLSVWSHGDLELSPPKVCNFFFWPKVGYFLDREVLALNIVLLN
jgi:hypothetical protein